jgi:hypothetical protein
MTDFFSDQSVEFYNKYVVPKLTTKNKVIAISTAVALSTYLLVDRLFRPPKNLRHIPYQSYFSFVQSAINKENYCMKAERFALPFINSPANNNNSIYMVNNSVLIHVYIYFVIIDT